MEEKGIIVEGIHVTFYDRGLGGRNSNPLDALQQMSMSDAIVGLRIAKIAYDLRKGTFVRSAWENYKRDALPNMLLNKYYLLHEGQDVHAAMKSDPSHYLWDVYWDVMMTNITTDEESDVVGVVVVKGEVSPAGEVIREDEPIVFKVHGLPCNEGEIPLPPGLQTTRTK